MKDEIVLYQPDKSIRLEVRLQDDTVWINQQRFPSGLTVPPAMSSDARF